jgi:hypothetical protein
MFYLFLFAARSSQRRSGQVLSPSEPRYMDYRYYAFQEAGARSPRTIRRLLLPWPCEISRSVTSRPDFLRVLAMNPLRRAPAFAFRAPRLQGRPSTSWVRWSNTEAQATSKVSPTFSLEGKVSCVILCQCTSCTDVTGLSRYRSCSGTWERVLSCFHALVRPQHSS